MEPTTAEEKQFEPEILEKRRKSTHYKWKSQLYKQLAIGLFCMLTLVSFLLGWALKGNTALQLRLNDRSVTTIYPNGRAN